MTSIACNQGQLLAALASLGVFARVHDDTEGRQVMTLTNQSGLVYRELPCWGAGL
jgi:hypothetical protein